MLRETIEEQNDENNETDQRNYRYGDIHLVRLKLIEYSSVPATLTIVDLSGVLIGAVISVSLFVCLQQLFLIN